MTPETEVFHMAQPLPVERSDPFDPPTGLARLREEQPLSRLAYPDGHLGWLVTSDDLARKVLTDKRFSARMELRHEPVPRPRGENLRPGKAAPPGFYMLMDPPDHTRYKRLVAAQFTARRINAMRPRVEQIVHEHLDAMEKQGPPVDLVTAFAVPIPTLVICELLGVPYEERSRFQTDTGHILSLTATDDQVSASMRNVFGYMAKLVGEKKIDPGDDLLSGLLATGELADQEVASLGMFLLIAGLETNANMISLGTYALLRHPEQLEALRTGVVPVSNAVDELLRYLTVVQFSVIRAALEDVEIDGQLIRKDECVTVSLPAINRDPARFERPDDLDLSRHAAGHLAFGHGMHLCTGHELARMELREAFSALLERFPRLRLAAEPQEISMRADMAIYGVHELPVAW
ncbi:cytochrome P450 [Lentzea sp. NPDC051208]|uniref:cytochrome P450 n=1 Tax=Lentzea sp. NPDC051208 TaxID=3154642 RepID=UPI00344A178F